MITNLVLFTSLLAGFSDPPLERFEFTQILMGMPFKVALYATEAEIAAARAVVGYQHVRLDEKANTVELLKSGMQLDLGGIAVGYAVDEALVVLRKHGITRALIDGSGDIGVSDAPPGTAGWR